MKVEFKRDTSYGSVLDYLRSAILDGTLEPGTQLKQSVIAEQLGISMGPVREALIHLAADGLVENIPYHGMFVRKLTPKDVREIYLLREVLELLAIRLAYPKLKEPQHLKKLTELHEMNTQAEKDQDYDQSIYYGMLFHRYFVELSGNSKLLEFWDALVDQTRYALLNVYKIQSPQGQVSRDNEILDVIKQGDLDAIQRVLSEHLEVSIPEICATLEVADEPADR